MYFISKLLTYIQNRYNFFNNLTKQPNFPARPEPPGLPQQETPKTTRTRYEGKAPVLAVCLASVTVMAARKEQGGQYGQQESFSVKF